MHQLFLFNSLTLAFLMALTVGCATQASHSDPDSDLNAKVKAEAPANTPTEIARRGAQAFVNAPGLTPEQKLKLLDVFNRTYDEAIKIRGEIGQSKSLMFKLVASKDFDSKEVNELKKRIVALDQKRLNIMFKALADVQAIVGTGSEKEEIYKHFYDFEYHHSMYSQK